MKKLCIALLCASFSLGTLVASAEGSIPDHCGTSMEGIEIGTQSVNKNVKKYFDLFEKYGNQYGVDPNLLASICQQESSGINWSFRVDGTEMPAWGIMQIEYTHAKSFAEFGLKTTGEEWTLQDRLDPEKSIAYAAKLVSDSLIHYDCDYLKTVQSYNFGQTVLDRIIEATGDEWMAERENAAEYATNWTYPTYGDKIYLERVLAYYKPYVNYNGAKVRVDGQLIKFDSQFPLIVEDRTLIPVRGLFEKLGASVSWNQKALEATIKYKNTTIVVPINKDYTYVNGVETPLDVSAKVLNGRTMVPLRFIMDNFGFDVSWDQETRTVFVK